METVIQSDVTLSIEFQYKSTGGLLMRAHEMLHGSANEQGLYDYVLRGQSQTCGCDHRLHLKVLIAFQGRYTDGLESL